MRVFISWSGEHSRQVAAALSDWLPHVIQAVTPWLSHHDVRSGDRWFSEIASQLDAHDYGLLCLTRSNLDSPWIHFEAGALAKSVERGRIVPLLHGIRPSDLNDPLSQFNAEVLDRAGVERLIQSMNALVAVPLASHVLSAAFARNWMELERALSVVAPAESSQGPSLESIDAKLDELLGRTPSATSQIARVQPRRDVPRAAKAVVELEALLSNSGVTGFRDKRAFRRFLIDVDDLNQLSSLARRTVDDLLADGWRVETRSGRHMVYLDHKNRPIHVNEPFLFPSSIRQVD